MRQLTAVRLARGDGLVGRTEAVVWWTVNEQLVDVLRALTGDGFQTLADAILELDFNIGGVAAVDLEGGVAFVSGSAVLVSGGVVLDGSTTGTWIEQRVPNMAGFAVNAYVSTTDDVTDLVAGVARGGGFVFGSPELAQAPDAHTAAQTLVIDSPSTLDEGSA